MVYGVIVSEQAGAMSKQEQSIVNEQAGAKPMHT